MAAQAIAVYQVVMNKPIFASFLGAVALVTVAAGFALAPANAQA